MVFINVMASNTVKQYKDLPSLGCKRSNTFPLTPTKSLVNCRYYTKKLIISNHDYTNPEKPLD